MTFKPDGGGSYELGQKNGEWVDISDCFYWYFVEYH